MNKSSNTQALAGVCVIGVTVALCMMFYVSGWNHGARAKHKEIYEIMLNDPGLNKPIENPEPDSPEVDDTWYRTIAGTSSWDPIFAADAKAAMQDGKITKAEREAMYGRKEAREADKKLEELNSIKDKLKGN